MRILTLDFESEEIVGGSNRSPKPVGVALKPHNKKSIYLAWGHPTENNCTLDEATSVMAEYIDTHHRVLMHNAKFDARILLEWFNIDVFKKCDDTLFLAFLFNPHERSLSLKPLADKYLHMPPEEQQDLKQWVLTNIKKASEKRWGAHISKAPGQLVGKYAIGDVDRTIKLYEFYISSISDDEGMMKAYQRELLLLRVIVDMEINGVPLSDNLLSEHNKWKNIFNEGDQFLEELTQEKSGSRAMFYKLAELGYLDESKVTLTPKGNPQFGREHIERIISNEKIKKILTTRSKLQKVISTYLYPWSESYNRYKRFYPFFQQTRGDEGYGTRTGRLSSNLQQIPHVSDDPNAPNLRTNIEPEQGHVILKRDFSSQEIRVAAHYTEGPIMQAYIDDPLLDVHTFVQELIKTKTHHELPRRVCKTITFLKLYGGGPAKLMEQVHCSLSEANAFFKAYDDALPEFKQLMKDVERQVRQGIRLRTWGGRLYDVEPAQIVNGHRREFYYKMTNVLIQGSSADQTKEAMIRYYYHPDRKGRILLQVHDELVVTCPQEHAQSEMKILQWAMDEQPGWDVPMLSDGKIGQNFGELEDFVHERT